LTEVLWSKFYEEVRKRTISELTFKELRTYNPGLYQEIVEHVLEYASSYEAGGNRKQLTRNSRDVKRKIKRRVVKIGDCIDYEGIQFYVIGWKGSNLLVKDLFGNVGQLPNDTRKYTIKG
jgi:hypothetical protein